MLLVALYLLTRRLWLSIGFHMAWIFCRGGIFSGSVSGAFEQSGLFKAVIEGPAMLTGGKFSVAASVVALVICTTAGLAFLLMAVKRGNIVPPFWKRSV